MTFRTRPSKIVSSSETPKTKLSKKKFLILNLTIIMNFLIFGYSQTDLTEIYYYTSSCHLIFFFFFCLLSLPAILEKQDFFSKLKEVLAFFFSSDLCLTN